MQSNPVPFDVKYRGNVADCANDIWNDLQECPELAAAKPGGPEGLGRRGGAQLGVGTVIITVIATAVLQAAVKRGVDSLIDLFKKLRGVEDAVQKETTQAVDFHLAVELTPTSIVDCTIDSTDESRVIETKLSEWRVAIEAKLADQAIE